MPIRLRLAVWFGENLLQAVVMSLVMTIVGSWGNQNFWHDLFTQPRSGSHLWQAFLFGFLASMLIAAISGYLVITAICRLLCTSVRRIWLYPVVAAVLTLIQCRLIFGAQVWQDLANAALSTTAAFLCTAAGSMVLVEFVDKPQPSISLDKISH